MDDVEAGEGILLVVAVGIIGLGRVLMGCRAWVLVDRGQGVGLAKGVHLISETATGGAKDVGVLGHGAHLIGSALVASEGSDGLRSILSSLDVFSLQVPGATSRIGQGLRSAAFNFTIGVIESSLFLLNEISGFYFIANLVLRVKGVSVAFCLPSFVVNISVSQRIIILFTLVRHSVTSSLDISASNGITFGHLIKNLRPCASDIIVLHRVPHETRLLGLHVGEVLQLVARVERFYYSRLVLTFQAQVCDCSMSELIKFYSGLARPKWS